MKQQCVVYILVGSSLFLSMACGNRAERERIAERAERERIAERAERERIAERAERESIAEREKRERIAERAERESIAEREKRESIAERERAVPMPEADDTSETQSPGSMSNESDIVNQAQVTGDPTPNTIPTGGGSFCSPRPDGSLPRSNSCPLLGNSTSAPNPPLPRQDLVDFMRFSDPNGAYGDGVENSVTENEAAPSTTRAASSRPSDLARGESDAISEISPQGNLQNILTPNIVSILSGDSTPSTMPAGSGMADSSDAAWSLSETMRSNKSYPSALDESSPISSPYPPLENCTPSPNPLSLPLRDRFGSLADSCGAHTHSGLQAQQKVAALLDKLQAANSRVQMQQQCIDDGNIALMQNQHKYARLQENYRTLESDYTHLREYIQLLRENGL